MPGIRGRGEINDDLAVELAGEKLAAFCKDVTAAMKRHDIKACAAWSYDGEKSAVFTVGRTAKLDEFARAIGANTRDYVKASFENIIRKLERKPRQ